MPWLWIGAGLVGFVLALVNVFRKEPSPALILAYAGVQGIFVGAISAWYEAAFGGGIVGQAVVATLVVVGVTLALFASGKIRASKRATKIFLVAMVGYLVFSLVNLGLMLFGVTDDAFGLRSQPSPPIFGIPWGRHHRRLRRDPRGVLARARLRLHPAGRPQPRPPQVQLDRRVRHHGHGHLAVPRDPADHRDLAQLAVAAP